MFARMIIAALGLHCNVGRIGMTDAIASASDSVAGRGWRLAGPWLAETGASLSKMGPRGCDAQAGLWAVTGNGQVRAAVSMMGTKVSELANMLD